MSQKTENSAKETYEYLIERIEKSENTYDIYHQFKRLKEFLDKEIQNERVSEIWAKEKLSYIENEISRLKSDLGIISEQTFIIDVTNLQKQFEYMFPTMKAYLESKGMILPIDAGDMLEIFIERAFNDGEHGHLKTLLNRNDFIEFHKMIEARLIEIEPKRKQPKPTNKTAQKMYEKELKNRPIREAVINKAAELINSTGNEYQTPKNNCQSWLWKHPKIIKIDKGNSRGWLDNAIKDGTIESRLKKLSRE